MAPKGGKKNAPVVPQRNWDAALASTPFEEESWQASVSLVVGEIPEDEEVIKALAAAMQQPLRKLFTFLTWDIVLSKINELVHLKEKAGKHQELPVFIEVMETAKALLDEGEEISCDLVAKLLKSLLLHIKADDQKRRHAEQAKKEDRKDTCKGGGGKDKAGAGKEVEEKDAKAKEAAHPNNKASEKKSKVAPSPPPPKKTKLRRRDEFESPTYKDDEPEDGPQHYILIMGFYQPHLIIILDAIGVHVANVIKLHTGGRHSWVFQQELQRISKDSGRHSQKTSSFIFSETSLEDQAAQAKAMEIFWAGLKPLLDRAHEDSKLSDVVELNYSVPDFQPSHTQDADLVLELGILVYDGVAGLIYECLKWRRQHRHYVESMRFSTIQTSGRRKIAAEDGLFDDMRYYCNLLDRIPPEACSIPLIVDCMLQQVVVSLVPDLTQSKASRKSKPGPWLDSDLAVYMLQSFLPLARTDEQKRHMLNSLLTTVESEERKGLVERFGEKDPPKKKPDQLLVLRHHDERGQRLRETAAMDSFDPAEVERSMMKLSPVWGMIQSVADLRRSSCNWLAVKQQLQHYCTDDVVSWSEVERLFHQSVFEAMPLTGLDQNGELPSAAETLELPQGQTPTILPWDNPVAFAKQQLYNPQDEGLAQFLTEESRNTEEFSDETRCHPNLSRIQSCRLRSLFDWHCTEYHDPSVFPQVLQAASEEYRCLDTFRGSLNNILYIFCHNPKGPQYQCKESWKVAIHTDVMFRNYLEHVADSILEWTLNEEAKRQAMKLLMAAKDDNATEDEDDAEEEHTREPFLRKESLKAWKLEQERIKEEEELLKAEKAAKAKKANEDSKTSPEKTKPARETKSARRETQVTSAKTPKKGPTPAAPPVPKKIEVLETNEKSSGFIGYSMNGRLIHLSGQLQYLFLSDGAHITVEKISYIKGSSLIKVALKKDGHRFYTYINRLSKGTQSSKDIIQNAHADSGEGPQRVKQGSLSAALSNGIHLSYSFYGPTGECVCQEVIKNAKEEVETGTEDVKKHNTNSQEESQESEPEVCEAQPPPPPPPVPPFSSLYLSVPNGLLLQFLRDNAQGLKPEDQAMMVRQSFPVHGRGAGKHLPDPTLSKELSRVITSNGTVVRFMRGKTTEVLFADGSVTTNQQEEGDDRKSDGGERWLTTTPTGARISTVGNRDNKITPLLTYKATDPMTLGVLISREDLVVSVKNRDGSRCVDHADGTRITSILQERPVNTEEQQERVAPNANSECECAAQVAADTCDNGDGAEKAGSEEAACSKCDKNMSCQEKEKPVSTEETMTKKSEKRRIKKERVVMVEKGGCATVVMYPERRMAHVFLADGTVVTGNNQGVYQVFPSSVGYLQILSDGKCVYSSDTLVTPSPQNDSPTKPPGSYTLSHSDEVACDTTDPDGNHFQVMEDGQISVTKISPTLEDDNEEGQDEEENGEVDRLYVKDRQHCPRLLMVHEDGSATELLSSWTVEELLYQVYSNPTVAVLKEPLPDTEDEFGITILKPGHQSVWSQWMLKKQNPNITPPNLRNRSWHDFPCVEGVSPGPFFGANMGRGLTVGEQCEEPVAQHQPPVISCPEVLEMREIHQHRPFSMQLKNTVDARLKEYIQSLVERDQQSEDMKIKDPRPQEESIQAADLLNLVLSFPEEAGANGSFDKGSTVDIQRLYTQGIRAQDDESYESENTSTPVDDSIWPERLAHHRHELCEEKACRKALRNRNTVHYFHPENTPLYQELLQAPTLSRQSRNLSSRPKSRGFQKDFSRQQSRSLTPRPPKPTPSQSASHVGHDGMADRRPTNPTPQCAGESSQRSPTRPYRSVLVDVTGKPRKSQVRLPRSILSSKPFSVPNHQYLSVEEPVRRRCRMISLVDPSVVIRGFQLLPASVDFGTVQEGTSTTFTVLLKNVGVDTCRFQVKHPRLATGLRVMYSPGAVPAGLYVELHIELFAMCTTEAVDKEPERRISQDIVIHTETDILYLPVTATILSEKLYDDWLKGQKRPHKKTGFKVHCLSPSLPSGHEVMQTTQPSADHIYSNKRHS